MAGLGLFMRRRAISSNPVTNPLKDYVFYEKLKGDGVAYIDTQYYPSSYDNFIVTFDATGIGDSLKLVMGSRESASGKQMFLSAPRGSAFCTRFYNGDAVDIQLQSGVNKAIIQLLPNDAGKYVVENITIDGFFNRTLSSRGSEPSEYNLRFPLMLFASNTMGTSAIDSRTFNGSIMEVKIYDARTQEVKRSWKPCTYKGVPGLYEEVEGIFYGNSNSQGQFLAI